MPTPAGSFVTPALTQCPDLAHFFDLKAEERAVTAEGVPCFPVKLVEELSRATAKPPGASGYEHMEDMEEDLTSKQMESPDGVSTRAAYVRKVTDEAKDQVRSRRPWLVPRRPSQPQEEPGIGNQ